MKIQFKKYVLTVYLMLSLFVMNPGVVLADATLSDSFDDNKIDRSKWISHAVGGPTIAEVNDRLEINIPADSTDPFSFIGEYVSACSISGDFDIQVNYHLLEWPSQNGIRMGISTGPDNYADTLRVSWGPNDPSFSFNPDTPEVYLTNPNRVVIGTNDLSGKLRLKRVGNIETGYYFDSVTESWAEISSSFYTTSDVHMYLSAWSHDQGPFGNAFGDKEVKVAFDNLIVQGMVSCRDRYNPANPPVF